MNNLNIVERHNQNVAVLDLTGKIKMGDDIGKLGMALQVVGSDGVKNVLLNMAGISYIDSSGLGELIAVYHAVKRRGGELKLLHLTDRVSQLMVITKLLTVFESFDGEDEAVRSFQTVSKGQTESVTGKLDRALLSQ
ncbi:MAG TPA: STAS domain-containing protein [Pyrinomonadaceae bacterium]|jgi:anti-sigma B factor antagonist